MSTAVMIAESEIRRVGEDLAKRSAGHLPTLFNARWWTGRLLDWCMKDERFKVQLFRFIDVLPCLHSDTQVAGLIEEYFGNDDSGPQ